MVSQLKDAERSLRIKQAGKVAMQAFVSGDELVRECKPRHDSPLSKPEYGAETAQTEQPQTHR